jgi:hypothetical protein
MANIQTSQRHDAGDSKVRSLRLATALVFSLVALLLRFAPLPENFACFGALSLFCGLMLKGPMRWALPMLTLFAADCLGHFLGTPQMGFYSVQSMILNYLGMAAMILVGTGVGSITNLNRRDQWHPWAMVGAGCLVGSMLFFLISNFGAWLDPLMGYDRTLAGLIRCYAMGLPFFRPTLISDLCFGLGFFAVYQWVAVPATSKLYNLR